MKPGKPLTFAEILPGSTSNRQSDKVLAFGLPGNPVSCLVCFNLFVVPAIRRLSGWANPHLPRFLKVVKQCAIYFSHHFEVFVLYLLSPFGLSTCLSALAFNT